MLTKSRISEVISRCFNGMNKPKLSTAARFLVVPSALLVSVPIANADSSLPISITSGSSANPIIITVTEFKNYEATQNNPSALIVKSGGVATGENLVFENNSGVLINNSETFYSGAV